MYKIRWTSTAWDSYQIILTYMVDNGFVSSAQKLDDALFSLLDKLKNNRHLCPVSDSLSGLRKCVVSKKISLIYRANDKEIELVAFFDNRSNHSFS